MTPSLIFKHILCVITNLCNFFIYWVKFSSYHNVDFSKNELRFMPLTIFNLNPILLLMMKRTRKHFLFRKLCNSRKSLNLNLSLFRPESENLTFCLQDVRFNRLRRQEKQDIEKERYYKIKG